MLEQRIDVVLPLPQGTHITLPSAGGSAVRARMLGVAAGAGEDAELEALRKQVQQQRLALGRLTDALLTLRRGTQALRDENRELRHELDTRGRQPDTRASSR